MLQICSISNTRQMLLDAYTLKTGFSQLLPPPQPAAFTKRVNQSMSKIDPLLKTLQVRPSPPEALVQAYLIHIADRSDANFKKILELKGINKKGEQGHLLELFQVHRTSDRYNNPTPNKNGTPTGGLVDKNPILTSLAFSGQNTSLGNTSSLPTSTPTLNLASLSLPGVVSSATGVPARFDPRDLGNALLSAARDLGPSSNNKDNAGTGTGAAASPSGVMSPPQQGAAQAAANLNENLRNLGKFFKRDVGIGGFGGKFGRD